MSPLDRGKSVPQPAAGSDAIAPDTQGMNFFDADRALGDLLRLYLPAKVYGSLLPHFRRMGALAANELDACARLADRHPPVLHPRDRFGRDVQSIEYHPAYHEMERIGFGDFGMHAMSHRAGVLGQDAPIPTAAKHAFTFLFNQAEFGLGCPINVTDSGILLIRRYGAPELQERFLPRMLTQDMDRHWQGAQFITEKEGGSDVGSATTRAVRDGDRWRIHGEKWFCSNADAEVVQLLARPEEAGPGTRGLGLFLMPRWLEDGEANRYSIVRLKDKLGTRSMASGEVTMDGAVAYQLGELDRGFVQMADMINWSRLSNGVKSTAIMRRAAHDATTVARGRRVFGRRIADLPLARRQLLKILLPGEQALSLFMATSDALDQAGDAAIDPHGGSQSAAALLRILTPILKFRATRDARKVAGDALEMRGGVGYVEEFVTPRLVRDAHLGSVWEGTSNIVALDVVRRAIARHDAQNALRATLHQRLDDADGAPAPYLDRLRGVLDRAIGLAETVARTDDEEANARHAASALYHAATACLMAWEGARIHAECGDARRLLWSALVLEHRLSPSDPLGRPDTRREDAIATHLLDDRPVALAEAAALLHK